MANVNLNSFIPGRTSSSPVPLETSTHESSTHDLYPFVSEGYTRPTTSVVDFRRLVERQQLPYSPELGNRTVCIIYLFSPGLCIPFYFTLFNFIISLSPCVHFNLV